MKQFLRYLPLAALLALVTVLVWLLGTTSGLRWTFARLVPMLPAEVTVRALDGRLIGPIEIDGLEVRHPALDLRIARLEMDWTPIALLRATLHIDRLYARDVDVQPREQPPSQAPTDRAALPLALQIDDARVEKLVLRRAAESVVVDRIDLAGGASGEQIEITRLAVALDRIAVTMQGAFTHRADNVLDGRVQWSADIAGVPRLEGGGTVRASAARVALSQRLTVPAALALDGELRQVDGAWRWSAELALERLALQQLRAGWPAVSVSGRLQGRGGFETFQVQAALQARHAQQTQSMPAARLQARLDWGAKGAVLNASWQDLAWPVTGKWLTSPKGGLHARGTPSAYTLRTQASLRYDRVAAGQLHANVRGETRQLRLDRFSLQAEGARLEAHGLWRPTGFDLTWDLDAADLSRIVPTLAGSVVSRGRAHGNLRQPRIDAFLNGRGLAVGSNRVGALQARARIDARVLHIELNASGVDAGPATLDRAAIRADGELARHRLHAELVRGERRLALDAEGGYAGGAWNGAIAQARLASERYGSWLARPAALSVRRNALTLETWCWHRGENRLCAGGRWNGAGPPANAVSLRLAADMQELSLIAALMPGVEALQGRLQADIRVDGTLDNPRLAGHATLAQAGFRVPQLGIAVREAELRLQETGANAFSIAARARSGKGVLTMNGRVGVGADHPWDLRLSIDGDDFEVANTPDAQVQVSPALRLAVYPRVVRVEGTVRVPRASFHPLAGAGAVRPSPDAVIVGTPQPQARTDWAVSAQVRVVLGDDVSVSGFKLNAKVTGAVTVQEKPKQPTLAQGEFRIAAGEYEVYGQKIRIERGRLVYTGGTIDDPGLDMRAIRRINDDVRVGVEARGTLRAPRLTLVSEPAMSDTDVLSYLLLGRPSNQASQNEGSLLYRAATGLGLSGGEALAKRIGAIFGIRDVRIEEDEKTKTTSLLFGTYLSPRLYVSYGVGLFDAINTLRLRYQLSQHWSVQTESGADTGVDFLYTIER